MVRSVNAEELEELISTSDKTVFCDFWAAWCGPCRMLAPTFEALSEQYGDKAEFVKIDIDEESCESAAMKYKVLTIPNIIAFKGGNSVDNRVGYMPIDILEAFVNKNL